MRLRLIARMWLRLSLTVWLLYNSARQVHAMDILEVLDQVRELLQQKGRVTYRILKRQFALDDEALEELKEQLIDAEELAADKDGKMLVWAGDGETSPVPPQSQSPSPQPPSTYTPPHLAERIRAEQQAMEFRGAADGERKTITALFADLKARRHSSKDSTPKMPERL